MTNQGVPKMTNQGVPKMSLVAQYDDLCRSIGILTTGSEEYFKIFVESQRSLLRKLIEAESEVRELRDRICSIETERNRLAAQQLNLKSLLQDEIYRRRKVEDEKKSTERQIALIKEVLLADGMMDNQTKEKLGPCLATIMESTGPSIVDISDDATYDDLDLNNRRRTSRGKRRSTGKRSSSEGGVLSPKRITSELNEENIEDSGLPENGDLPFKTKVRCSSEPSNISPEILFVPHQVHKSDSDQSRYNTFQLRRHNNMGVVSGGTPVGRYSSGGKLSRTHAFAIKTVIRTERCYPCNRIIKFCKQALKCQDCRVICHPECKEQCPVPCIPTINTPTKGTVGTLADFVSCTSPMIPALIVHCVNEIEARGLNEIGLYRISGSEREVKNLKEKFLSGRTIPCLKQVDINAICGLVKEFLRSLQEPLITSSSWQVFVDAAKISDKAQSLKKLFEAVTALPQPNKDTLAFLILHLQRISESPDCKMPKENLAKVFGPTIVGYSVSDPVHGNMLTETSSQCSVMLRLLEISSDLWRNLLNVEVDVHQTNIKTPESTAAPKETRLGPIYAPGQKPRSSSHGITPHAQRNTRFSKSMRRNFLSPLLK